MKENKGEQPEQERERMKLPPELEKYFDKDPICSTELFAELKWAIGNFMWFHIKMNSDKTAIECNPASHAIAKYVYNKLTAAQPSKVQEKEIVEVLQWLLKSRFEKDKHICFRDYDGKGSHQFTAERLAEMFKEQKL